MDEYRLSVASKEPPFIQLNFKSLEYSSNPPTEEVRLLEAGASAPTPYLAAERLCARLLQLTEPPDQQTSIEGVAGSSLICTQVNDHSILKIVA